MLTSDRDSLLICSLADREACRRAGCRAADVFQIRRPGFPSSPQSKAWPAASQSAAIPNAKPYSTYSSTPAQGPGAVPGRVHLSGLLLASATRRRRQNQQQLLQRVPRAPFPFPAIPPPPRHPTGRINRPPTLPPAAGRPAQCRPSPPRATVAALRHAGPPRAPSPSPSSGPAQALVPPARAHRFENPESVVHGHPSPSCVYHVSILGRLNV